MFLDGKDIQETQMTLYIIFKDLQEEIIDNLLWIISVLLRSMI